MRTHRTSTETRLDTDEYSHHEQTTIAVAQGSKTMRFSWTALILAPLPVPLVLSIFFEMTSPGRGPILSFLFFFVLGSVLSYGTTIFIFLPCLFLLSKLTPLTVYLTGILGIVPGFLMYLPVTWQMYLSSGVDSGPPEGTFADYLRHHEFEWDLWALILAGLLTALLYWYLTSHRPEHNK